jgi:hypothetical protein
MFRLFQFAKTKLFADYPLVKLGVAVKEPRITTEYHTKIHSVFAQLQTPCQRYQQIMHALIAHNMAVAFYFFAQAHFFVESRALEVNKLIK